MRTKSAVLIVGINDTMMSYDLHIIDVMNNLRGRLGELCWMKLANRLMELYNAPGVLPLHELVFDNNKLQINKIGKINSPITNLNYWDFIYTKKDEFISKEIYDFICDAGYSKVIENTPVKFYNINTMNFLSVFYNFVVVRDCYNWSEIPLLKYICSGDNDNQIISFSKLGQWLEYQTERKQDDDLAIILTLISPNIDIDKEIGQLCLDTVSEDKLDLIACESRVITLNSRLDLVQMKKDLDSGTLDNSNRSNVGIVKLFNPNMTSKN